MQARNFTNKLYNAAKYLAMNCEAFTDINKTKPTTELGRFMYSKFAVATAEIRADLDSYRFSDAALGVYKFFWDEFCDWGIELSKVEKEAVAELGGVFREALKLLHPFMPFISEFLYKETGGAEKTIMLGKFPAELPVDKEIIEKFEFIKEAIISVRRAKTSANAANKKTELCYIKDGGFDGRLKESLAKYVGFLGKCEKVEFVSAKPENSAVDVGIGIETYAPMSDDAIKELEARLTKQLEKTEKERDKLSSMLSNEKFLANAPANLIEENKAALSELEQKLEKIKNELQTLK